MKDKNDILTRFIDALKNQNVPADPPQEVIDDTLQKLTDAGSVRVEERTTILRRLAKLTAAAVIIIIVSFVISRNTVNDGPDVYPIAAVSKSPARMLTLGSTTMAYRRGGMDAVEKQTETAFAMLGPRTTSMLLEDLP